MDLKITANIEEFNAGLKKYAAAVERRVHTVVKAAGMNLYTRIVERTPVDTGRAKAGWHIDPRWTAKKPLPGKTRYPPPSMEEPPDSAEYWIYNNVEYIEPLEHGHSKQAPQGMVGLALAEVGRALAQAIKDAERLWK